MEKAIVTASPQKLKEIRKRLEEVILENMSLKDAIIIQCPPDEIDKMGIKAMCHGADSFSRIDMPV